MLSNMQKSMAYRVRLQKTGKKNAGIIINGLFRYSAVKSKIEEKKETVVVNMKKKGD